MLTRVAKILDNNVELLIDQWAATLDAIETAEHQENRFGDEVRGTVGQMLRDIALRLERPPGEQNGEWKEATQRAQRLGRLRQEQGSHLYEVMQEYLVLREKIWTLYRERLRREDEPFLHFVGMLNEGIDSLLLATAEAFYRAHTEELERWAATDSLTGVLNRRYFFARLGEELIRSQRTGDEFSILMLDLNQFKRFNDEQGHQAGDSLLVAAAQAIRRSIRGHDILARYGGDEFIVLLHRSGLEPQLLARRIVQAVEGVETGVLTRPGTALPPIGVSVGIACYPKDGGGGDELVGVADAELYRAKLKQTHISGGQRHGTAGD